jgi:ATP-dependent Clp protease ATP-binding subunit ClpB
MLKELKDTLAERHINFMWDDALVDYLTHKSYSLTYGARNLRRLIQRELEDAIASLMIEQYMTPITQLKATVQDDKIQLLSL